MQRSLIWRTVWPNPCPGNHTLESWPPSSWRTCIHRRHKYRSSHGKILWSWALITINVDCVWTFNSRLSHSWLIGFKFGHKRKCLTSNAMAHFVWPTKVLLIISGTDSQISIKFDQDMQINELKLCVDAWFMWVTNVFFTLATLSKTTDPISIIV